MKLLLFDQHALSCAARDLQKCDFVRYFEAQCTVAQELQTLFCICCALK